MSQLFILFFALGVVLVLAVAWWLRRQDRVKQIPFHLLRQEFDAPDEIVEILYSLLPEDWISEVRTRGWFTRYELHSVMKAITANRTANIVMLDNHLQKMRSGWTQAIVKRLGHLVRVK